MNKQTNAWPGIISAIVVAGGLICLITFMALPLKIFDTATAQSMYYIGLLISGIGLAIGGFNYLLHKSQNTKIFTTITIILLILIATVHLFGLVYEWEIIINATVLPVWSRVLAIFVASVLAFMLWREM